jgi:hypothetical protein
VEVFCALPYHEIYDPVFVVVVVVEKSIVVDIYLNILVHWHMFPRTTVRRFASLPSSGGTRTSERWMERGNEGDTEGSGPRCHRT